MFGILSILDIHLMDRGIPLDSQVADDSMVPRSVNPETKKAAPASMLEFDTGPTAYLALRANRCELADIETSKRGCDRAKEEKHRAERTMPCVLICTLCPDQPTRMGGLTDTEGAQFITKDTVKST
jgi:hypothetical protein